MNQQEMAEIKRNDYIKSLLNIPSNQRDEKVLLELMSFTKHFKLFDSIGMTNEHAYICKSMKLANYKPNEVIVRQGDKGDSFFYILSGIVKIIITRKYDLGPEQGEIKIDKYIGDLKTGQTFGELSLIYGTERSATIVAVTNSNMIKIDKISFDSYVKDIFETQLKDEIDFMKTCPIFNKIEKERLVKLAIRTEMVKYSSGKEIMKMNIKPDVIYIVRRGSVEVSKKVKFLKDERKVKEKLEGSLESSYKKKKLLIKAGERRDQREMIEDEYNKTLVKGPSIEEIDSGNYIEKEVKLEIMKIGDIFPTYHCVNNINLDISFKAEIPCELILIKVYDLSDMIPEAYEFIKLYSKPYPNDEFLRKLHIYNSQWKNYKQKVIKNIKAENINKACLLNSNSKIHMMKTYNLNEVKLPKIFTNRLAAV